MSKWDKSHPGLLAHLVPELHLHSQKRNRNNSPDALVGPLMARLALTMPISCSSEAYPAVGQLVGHSIQSPALPPRLTRPSQVSPHSPGPILTIPVAPPKPSYDRSNLYNLSTMCRRNDLMFPDLISDPKQKSMRLSERLRTWGKADKGRLGTCT